MRTFVWRLIFEDIDYNKDRLNYYIPYIFGSRCLDGHI